MGILSVIAGVLLTATGIFASTGVIELLTKLLPWRNVADAITPTTFEYREEVRARSRAQRIPELEELRPYRHENLRRPSSGLAILYAAILVVCVFAISIGVIWTLTHIGGPLQATVNATIAKAGGSILIVGGGLFAAFFVVALMAFVAIRVFAGQINRH